MSKISYALIVCMTAALIYMGAVRWQESRTRNRQAQEEASRQDGEPFSFQHIPLSLAAPEAPYSPAPVEYRPQGREIFLEDTPLTPLQQQKQARDTIASILADFKKYTTLAGFDEEIRQASDGQVQGLEDLSTQNLAQIVQQHPQISHVVSKHLQNPDFSKVIDEIFQNPQFQQSVQKLQSSAAAQ